VGVEKIGMVPEESVRAYLGMLNRKTRCERFQNDMKAYPDREYRVFHPKAKRMSSMFKLNDELLEGIRFGPAKREPMEIILECPFVVVSPFQDRFGSWMAQDDYVEEPEGRMGVVNINKEDWTIGWIDMETGNQVSTCPLTAEVASNLKVKGNKLNPPGEIVKLRKSLIKKMKEEAEARAKAPENPDPFSQDHFTDIPEEKPENTGLICGNCHEFVEKFTDHMEGNRIGGAPTCVAKRPVPKAPEKPGLVCPNCLEPVGNVMDHTVMDDKENFSFTCAPKPA
jgi:hypothetical protein